MTQLIHKRFSDGMKHLIKKDKAEDWEKAEKAPKNQPKMILL